MVRAHGLYALIIVACTGCSLVPSSRPGPGFKAADTEADKKECRSLDKSFQTWGLVAAGSAALAGTGGLVTIETEDNAKYIAWGALVVGVVSAVSVLRAQQKAQRFSDWGCAELLRPK